MARELPVNWQEIEKAVIAGVPQRQVAQTMGEAAGVDTERLYKAIRKRASRERWPVPASIIRRAQLQSLVASGKAANAKEAACWKQGEPGWETSATCAAMAGQAVLSVEELDKQNKQSVTLKGGDAAGVALVAGGGCAGEGGEALPSAPPTAAELVTASLAQRGQTGLSLALDAALASLQSLQSSGDTVPIRSMQDLLTAVKATQAAAGLDKPSVAVAVSLNSGSNASIMAWEAVES